MTRNSLYRLHKASGNIYDVKPRPRFNPGQFT